MPSYKGKGGESHYSMNPQVGKSRYGTEVADREPGEGREEADGTGERPLPEGREGTTTITHHGDGTHSTQHHDGTAEEHPNHLHMLAALGHRISGGDAHHIIHHDGAGLHSHHVSSGGEHEGPHDHANVEELKNNMDQFLSEEGREGSKTGEELPLARRGRKLESEPDFNSPEDSSGISALM